MTPAAVADLEQATRRARTATVALIDDRNARRIETLARCVYDTDSPTGHQLDELVNAALDGWFHYQRSLRDARKAAYANARTVWPAEVNPTTQGVTTE